MNAGTAIFRSILDKPLKQLTEDDISQLTREDCRKFLKEKGMRRPSWNKSQAIEQVISLKALLEPNDDDSDAGTVRKITFVPPREDATPGNLKGADSAMVPGADVAVSAPDEEPVLQTSEELQKSGSSGEKASGAETNEKAVSPRGCETSQSVGQMTIFYCGKVNVYDEVPPDKARKIMQLAASPTYLPPDDLFNRTSTVWPYPCHLQMDKDALVPFDTTIPQVAIADKMIEYPLQYREKGSSARDVDMEGQASRKVSLQRYLEKRKDRERLKTKKNRVGTSSNFEMDLNHQLKAQASNGNSSRSSTSSPPQPRLPQASGGSSDNQLKIALPLDLNDKDVEEC
ncbi:hypothetical protein L6164_025721 [Bauhinia variegata]|uniref:Uncharacterized protein n=1 Tax=Bauhinia variegata TaxID=167791 RepID=A0ACB9M2T6_BAUVA|nr:hypothetical protein L6164_025721 [Bauhinia variegata]